MPVRYMLTSTWQWIADQGITLALLLVIAILIPRVGRLIQRFLNRNVEENSDTDESKTRLALNGVFVYIGQMIAYFLLLVFFLQTVGFSLAGAAIPATVVSAAIGFGAQSIIADFLAGFFILSEKQYGVGDWVRFEGNGVVVEGTVIQITMRATRIRTLAQATVIIPNSTARVSINTSNYWSRAVIVIPVPLLGSKDPQEAIDRSEAATRRALDQPEIAAELISELDVHPAVNINPPTTVGMPWTVDMRFMVQVEAGSQWMVERAVRTAILEEFWDEYGSATTVTGELQDKVMAPPETKQDLRGVVAPTAPLIDVPVDSAPTELSSVPAGYADEEGKDPAIIEKGLQVDEPAADAEGDEEKEEAAQGRWARIVSWDGRTRASTTYLFAVLLVLLILRGLTLDAGEDGQGARGVLAPRAPASQSTEEPVPGQAPVPEQEQAPTGPTGEPTPTPEQDPGQTGTQTTPSPQSPDAPQQTAPTGEAPQEEATPQPQAPAQTPAPAETGTPQTPAEGQSQPLN